MRSKGKKASVISLMLMLSFGATAGEVGTGIDVPGPGAAPDEPETETSHLVSDLDKAWDLIEHWFDLGT